jgi:hypothetical protein
VSVKNEREEKRQLAAAQIVRGRLDESGREMLTLLFKLLSS